MNTTIVLTHAQKSAYDQGLLERVAAESDGYDAHYYSADGKGWFAVPDLGHPFALRYTCDLFARAAALGVDLPFPPHTTFSVRRPGYSAWASELDSYSAAQRELAHVNRSMPGHSIVAELPDGRTVWA